MASCSSTCAAGTRSRASLQRQTNGWRHDDPETVGVDPSMDECTQTSQHVASRRCNRRGSGICGSLGTLRAARNKHHGNTIPTSETYMCRSIQRAQRRRTLLFMSSQRGREIFQSPLEETHNTTKTRGIASFQAEHKQCLASFPSRVKDNRGNQSPLPQPTPTYSCSTSSFHASLLLHSSAAIHTKHSQPPDVLQRPSVLRHSVNVPILFGFGLK